MSQSEQEVLICMAVTEALHVLPGAVIRYCSLCSITVWVSASFVARVDHGQIRPVCNECTPGALATSDDVEFAIHPDQVAELREAGILNYSQRLIRRLNEQGK